MSQETYPNQTTEPESYDFDIYLQGKGAAVPTVISGKGVTITRASAGVLTATFAADPGPTFLGMDAGGFSDVTGSNAAGWTVVVIGFTAKTTSAKATLAFTLYNSSFAAADIATTTTLKITPRFKVAKASL